LYFNNPTGLALLPGQDRVAGLYDTRKSGTDCNRINSGGLPVVVFLSNNPLINISSRSPYTSSEIKLLHPSDII
jgi:hypothetical protein